MPSRGVWTTSHNVKGSAFSLTYVKLEIVCCQLVGKVYILPLYKPPFVTENDHSLITVKVDSPYYQKMMLGSIG